MINLIDILGDYVADDVAYEILYTDNDDSETLAVLDDLEEIVKLVLCGERDKIEGKLGHLYESLNSFLHAKTECEPYYRNKLRELQNEH